MVLVSESCGRCGGQGTIRKLFVNHTCGACGGSGVVYHDVDVAKY